MAYLGTPPANQAITSEDIAQGAVTLNDISFTDQPTNLNITGTIDKHTMRLADGVTVTGDVTISDDLVLSKLSDDGNAITLTNDSSTRTITGSGSIEASTLAQTPNASLTGMTGTLGTGVFPAGHTIQTKYATDNTRYSFAPGTNTWAEMSTALRIAIQGASTSNKFLIRMDIPVSEGGTGYIWMFKFWNVTTGAIVTPYGITGYLSSSGAGHECHFGHRGSHSDANDSDLLTYTLVADVPNTNVNTYTIYGLCQTAQTFYVNYQHNGGDDTYSWTAVSNFMIQEIQG